MKIQLNRTLFKESPYERFADQHNCEPELWRVMYHEKYRFHEFKTKELQEYYRFKTYNDISMRTLRRWIKRTAVYIKAQYLIDEGAKQVDTSYFDNHHVPGLRNFVERQVEEK